MLVYRKEAPTSLKSSSLQIKCDFNAESGVKYTNGCRGVSGAKQQHFSFKTYLVFIRKRNITFEDILHYKYVPEQVIGDTTNDCSTWREESAQLRGLMPHRKDGAQSLQSGLGE